MRRGPAAGGFVFLGLGALCTVHQQRAAQPSWDRSGAGARGIAPEELELVSSSTTQDRHLDALGAVFTAIHRPQHGSLSLDPGPGPGLVII